MKFISTRDPENQVNFERAVLNSMPSDGGLYIPAESPDLRRWILYTNSKTSFQNLAGTLTSACINDEFSPIICETIATKAFTFEPKLTKYTDRFFTLELFNTPTGSHKEFGISFLVNSLETILQMKGGSALFVDVTVGELGASLARALRGKRHLKALLIYPKGMIRGLSENDYVWNGGNVYPVEIDGDEKYCHEIARKIFEKRDLVEKKHITLANTANIGRLMPQMFFYPFAFSRLKEFINSDIFYAITPGNYSNLVAGLYAWRLSLPVNGFICPATKELTVDAMGQCSVLDDMVPFQKRAPADAASPSNLERLEDVFHNSSLMLKNLVYPSAVTDSESEEACRRLFMKHKIFADRAASQAYAAALKQRELTGDDEAAVVLVMRDHPSYDSEWIQHAVGAAPQMPENISEALQGVKLGRPLLQTAEDVLKILEEF